MVDAVWAPLQAVPRLALEHVYVRAPEAAEGPPAGAKSDVTWSVIVPPPAGVVRAR